MIKRSKQKKVGEQKAYMREQNKKRLDVNGNPSNTPYDFSDLVGKQLQFTASSSLFDINTIWKDFRAWFIEEKILDPSLTREVANAHWKDLLASGNVRSTVINNVQCVACFGGGTSTERMATGFEHRLSRIANRGRNPFHLGFGHTQVKNRESRIKNQKFNIRSQKSEI